MIMKKNILFCLTLLAGTGAFAQDVLKVQNGAAITVQAGAQITVLGNVTLDNGSRLFNSGTVTLKQYGSAGTSNLTDNTITTYSYGSGNFALNSTGTHTLYSNNNFGRIDVNAGGVTLNSDITSGKWYLQAGSVTTGGNTAIVLGNTALALEAAPTNTNFANSWINGNLRRYINPSANDSYQFAVGNSGRHIAAMENMTATPLAGVQYIDADFTAKPGTDAGLVVTEGSAQYISVNPGGVWHFVPNNAPTAGKFNLKLFTNGFTGIQDNLFAILQRPDQSSNAADWTVPAGSSVNPSGGAGRLVADGYALRKDVSVLGQFGIGQTSSSALPVTLTNFSAKRLSQLNVLLDWQTQIETNNKGFSVERRTENETVFTSAGFINSKAVNGNSAVVLDYSFTDHNDYAGISYYRLKQTDLDDKSYYSLIKAVNGLNGSAVTVMLWPNPSKGQFSVKIDGNPGNKEIMITNLQGAIVKRITITGNQQVNINGLAAGAYVITIPDAMGVNKNFTEKIVVIK